MDSTFHGSLWHQLRGIDRRGDARVKARATVEHHHIVLRTGGQIHSFLSLQIKSGFVSRSSQVLEPFFPFSPNWVRLRAPAAGELLPPLGHNSSDGGRVTPSARAYFLILSGCASTRVYVWEAADDWIFLRSYLGFSYVHTDSLQYLMILQSLRWDWVWSWVGHFSTLEWLSKLL